MLGVVKAVADIASIWMQGKVEKVRAKSEREAELIRQDGNWDEINAKGAQSSWKDEFLLIVLTTPFILLFYGAMTDDQAMIARVAYAFQVIDETVPSEYWYLFGVGVAATFGVRKVIDFIGARKG